MQAEARLPAQAGVLLKVKEEALAGAQLGPCNEELQAGAQRELIYIKVSAQAHLWRREEALPGPLQDLHCEVLAGALLGFQGAHIGLPGEAQSEVLEGTYIEA
jgi:hypothetical protein